MYGVSRTPRQLPVITTRTGTEQETAVGYSRLFAGNLSNHFRLASATIDHIKQYCGDHVTSAHYYIRLTYNSGPLPHLAIRHYRRQAPSPPTNGTRLFSANTYRDVTCQTTD